MKLLKRLLLLLAVLIGAAVVFCAVGIFLFRGTPQWYQLPETSAEEREAAAQRATNKLAMIQNEAARARLDEGRQDGSGATSTTTPSATAPAHASAITVSFTDQELNAFFEKWAAWNDWKATYEKYVTGPVLILTDGRLILAGRVKELNTIASLHFEPRVNERGQLDLELVRVLGGNLPLPAAVLGDYRRRLALSMQQRLPQWRHTAAIDRAGTPNGSAICAAMGDLLVNVLRAQPGEPVLFLPLVDQGAVAVKLTHVEIRDHTLTLTVHPLSAAERAELLRRVKQNDAPAAAAR